MPLLLLQLKSQPDRVMMLIPLESSDALSCGPKPVVSFLFLVSAAAMTAEAAVSDSGKRPKIQQNILPNVRMLVENSSLKWL